MTPERLAEIRESIDSAPTIIATIGLKKDCADLLAEITRLESALAEALAGISEMVATLERLTSAIGSDGDWQGRCGHMAKRLRALLPATAPVKRCRWMRPDPLVARYNTSCGSVMEARFIPNECCNCHLPIEVAEEDK